MNTIEEIAGVLSALKSAVIFTHTRPDGDTLGSAGALSRALSMLGVRCETVNDGAIPAKYLFLDSMRRILRAPTLDAEAYICVDCSEESRLGALESVYRAGARKKVTVNLDHHVSNTRFAKYNYVAARASNCENIAALIRALGVEPDREAADCLMMGMVTDSGGFSHADVNGDTFREAAYAADHGADPARVGYEVFRKQTRARAALYAETVSKLRFLLGGRLVIAVIPRDALVRRSLGADATDGIVDFGLTVDTAEVSVCLLEVRTGQYKVSFRSKGKVNVNETARRFGGGGHVLAAGCMLFGPLEEAVERVERAVSQDLEE